MQPAPEAGWDRIETLRRDAEFVLSRGIATQGSGRVLMLAAASEQPAPRTIERLKHEYALRHQLDPAWAAKPRALAGEQGRTVLVLDDPGAEPLSRLVGRPWDIEPFLRVAGGIAVALGRVHAQGLIHKDVKPDHLLVDTASGAAWLTGFGIASRLVRERQAPDLPETIAGSLAYMAPEQTGRMNRSVDARSDLYALGVTLYQMLTGELPFTAADSMELVHCHIARRPVPPAERAPGVPAAVSALVMKLLAKTAEDRYQTAAGVAADLRRCLGLYEAAGSVEAFPLGAHDIPDVLRIPEKLYGRQREVGALLAAFERVVSRGTPELVLVRGYSGVGKSSIVSELHKAIVPPRGLFASGKFDQYQRDIPYATLAQAFQTLVRQLLTKTEADIGRWRDALSEALGPNGQLMVNLIPELELIIGKQPGVPELAPQDAQNRFQRVFRRLIGVFARPEHPLALFLDDLQWLDAATLTLLADLATQSDVRHLLLVGAYRDNEVDPTHPLVRSLDAIRTAGAPVHDIVLAPLALDDVRALIADSLHCEHERTWPLAQLVYEKTGGNPFFAMQFLTALAEEVLLAFDHDAAAWTWDLARIRAKGYTDNVADLMAAKLSRLPEATRDALGQLACLGNAAGLATLAIAHGGSAEKIHAGLWEAVQAGFVFRVQGAYAFVHDRIHEAAYALIPDARRAAEHLRIGRALASRLAPEALEESIFDVVNHLNRGAALIATQEERVRVAELNLRAGKRAKGSTAYASALSYLVAGRELLAEDCWIRFYPLVFALELQRAECEFLTGNAAAEERLSMLAERARRLVDVAAVACSRQVLYTTLDRLDRSVEVGLDYLRKVGVDWIAHPTKEDVYGEYEQMLKRLGASSIEQMADLPRMSDPECCATVEVLTELVPGAYFTDINLLCLVVCRIANLSLEQGNSNGSVYAYSLLGFLLRTRFGDPGAGFRFGKLALNLSGEPGLDRFRARVYLNFAYCVNPWTRHIRTGRTLLRRGLAAAHETGDLTFAAYLSYCLMTDLLASGDPLDEAEQEAESGLRFASKARFGLVVDILTGHLRLIRALRGVTAAPGSFSDAQFDEEDFERHLEADPRLANPTCVYWIRKLQARFFAGDYESAVAAASKAEPLLWTSPASFETADYHFYAGLARAARSDLAALAAHHRQIAAWAGNCPENFENREALLAAEIARIEGRDLDAMRLYEKAIRSARDNRFVQNEALASELAGRFYLERGLESNGHAHLRDARACYSSWGADGKLRQLDDAHPALRQAPEPAAPASSVGAPVEHLDLASVVKVSQAVSEEIVLERLIDKLMSIALEHAGAQRGLLILQHGGVQRIEAEAAPGAEKVKLGMGHAAVSAADMPESVLRYVIRTQDSVLLDDASLPNPYSEDPYIAQNRSRSMLCLPLLKQARLIGVLYLENALAPRVFTPARIAVLKLLASQAAISLENARLYTDLRRSEERYALAVEAAGDGHTDWILATDEFYASPRLLEMCGFAAETRFAGRADFLARFPFHPEDRARVAQALDGHYAGAASRLEIDLRVLRRGEMRWMHLTVLCSRDASGALVRASSAVTDVTERMRAQEDLLRLERRLRQAQRLEAMGTLAGGIAHDFNNILGAVLGFGERAMNDAPHGSRLYRDLDSIMSAGERGRALVDRILAFSSSSVGERVAVHVETVVRETLDLLAGRLPPGVRVDADLRTGRAATRGDPTQVHQLLLNLATNALHAMAAGGTLRVALEARRVEGSCLMTVGSLAPGDYIVLTVGDTGTGMAPEVLERIFDPFFTTKEVGIGTGLGLSLVHGIVANMEGAIDVTSRRGEGSVFAVYLPRSGDVADSAEESRPAMPRGARQRVLVVDDEEPLVRLATETLEDLGYVPLGFTSSASALEAFRADPQRFDALITDERMPGMTGSALIREVRGIRGGIPIVLMSGFVGGGMLARAREAGADEVLKKPLSAHDLANSLARMLAQ